MPEDFDLDKYWKERYLDQCAWYDRKSGRNKKWFLGVRLLVLAGAISVPIVLSFSDSPLTLVASILAGAVAFGEGALAMLEWHEKWIKYRTTAETLKKEGELFKARAGPYDGASKQEKLFVERVESLISRENTEWEAQTRQASHRK